jgi:hypothetical protein
VRESFGDYVPGARTGRCASMGSGTDEVSRRDRRSTAAGTWTCKPLVVLAGVRCSRRALLDLTPTPTPHATQAGDRTVHTE